MERVVRFPDGDPPGWPAVAARLSAAGAPAVLRMIDGLPAFPDEVPPDGWAELRVGLAGGMVTLRRAGGEVRCVAWGTGDPALTHAWNLCAWAVADAGGGRVLDPGGAPQSPDEFRRAAFPA